MTTSFKLNYEESSVITKNFGVPRIHQAFHTAWTQTPVTKASVLSCHSWTAKDKNGLQRIGADCWPKAKHNYCATRKELHVVVTFILYFRPYLLRLKFNYKLTKVRYNEFTETLRNRKDKLPDGWKKLQQFEFEIIHRKGLRHTNANALSDSRVLSVTLLRNKD